MGWEGVVGMVTGKHEAGGQPRELNRATSSKEMNARRAGLLPALPAFLALSILSRLVRASCAILSSISWRVPAHEPSACTFLFAATNRSLTFSLSSATSGDEAAPKIVICGCMSWPRLHV